jgi:8-oxo-dGTP diphosphatase
METRFNIRVYGLLISEGKVLLTDEIYAGKEMTKFPGGGLEFGEGTTDTLKRELKEELNLEDFSYEHFYTTDFFQASAFHKDRQLISIYYLVTGFKEDQIAANDLDSQNGSGVKIVRFAPISELEMEHLTFPIDKKVVSLLKQKFI